VAADDDALAFAEQLLTLLDEGSFVSTYKFAVLLALMDLCFEHTNKHGAPPPMVTTPQLAVKVVELFWAQSRGFEGGDRLQQNAGPKPAKVLRLIEEFRVACGDPSATLFKARLRAPNAYERLLRNVEWTLVLMPLPKLQRVGRELRPFIYDIGWSDDIKKSQWRDPHWFDNRIHFIGRAAEHLVRLSGLLRPMIQHKWAQKVAQLNALEITRLESYLFGSSRQSLSPVRAGLRDIQKGDCFYCQRPLRSAGEVDHFLPWARHPDDGIDNLVVAHAGCNSSKRDFLVAARHLGRWRERTEVHHEELEQLAGEKSWPREPSRILGSVRAVYLRLPEGVSLWLGRDEFEAAEAKALRSALAA